MLFSEFFSASLVEIRVNEVDTQLFVDSTEVTPWIITYDVVFI